MGFYFSSQTKWEVSNTQDILCHCEPSRAKQSQIDKKIASSGFTLLAKT